MVDIKEQKTFDLLTEEKDIVITNNLENPLVKQLDEIFGGVLKDLSDKAFTTLYTLGKLKAKRVHVVKFSKLTCNCKKDDIYNSIAAIDVDTVVLVDTFENKYYQQIMQDMSERIMTNNYVIGKFKAKVEEKNKDFYYYGETEIEASVKKGYVYGESVNMAKDLVNAPYNYMNATDLANFAKNLERHENVVTRIYDKKEIEDMNMGSFLGVNKGSVDEPKLIYVKYQGLDKWDNQQL